jgi:hypothetical protein
MLHYCHDRQQGSSAQILSSQVQPQKRLLWIEIKKGETTMKTEISYFSGSRNSLAVAQNIKLSSLYNVHMPDNSLIYDEITEKNKRCCLITMKKVEDIVRIFED